MREIKFRAWDKKHKQMVNLDTPTAFCESGYDEIDYIAFSEGAAHYVDSSQVVWVEQYELMQYTGLKDKNGVEIYEGDILGMKEHWSWGDTPQEVEYISGSFHPFGTGDWEPDIEYNQVEVIGNIYENPELLENS